MNNIADAKGAGKGKAGNKGRFKPGKSGNPKGRPRQKPKEPITFMGYVGRALAQEISVSSASGKKRMPAAEFLAAQLVQSSLRAPFKEQLLAAEKFQKLGALTHMDGFLEEECQSEPVLPEESRRLLAITLKEIGDWGEDDFEAGHVGSEPGDEDGAPSGPVCSPDC